MTAISTVVVANRGEIARRIIETCRRLGLETVLCVSEVDRDSLPARIADRTVCIGPAHPARSYLRTEAVVAAALGVGADAVHPGYGFLAENPDLARACEEHGLVLLGPSAATMRLLGDKVAARHSASGCDVPVLPATAPLGGGSSTLAVTRWVEMVGRWAQGVGYPVMVKAAAGGGGRGMRVVADAASLAGAVEIASAEAEAAFGDGTIYVEKLVPDALHVEVQFVADGRGAVAALGDRDCSTQRRHQKVVEEGPATRVPEAVRRRMAEGAERLVHAAGYQGVGTVEYLFDRTAAAFYFLEVNSRIQVEHPVTEALTDLDLVALQLAVAAGEPLAAALPSRPAPEGHAIECRLTAEDPADGFRPSPGRLTAFSVPVGPGVRVDTHCFEGYEVPPYYDSLLAKVVVHGSDRADAIERMRGALDETVLEGIATNLGLLRAVIASEVFSSGRHNTAWLEDSLAGLVAPGRTEPQLERLPGG